MANLVLTTQCNRTCAYCFTGARKPARVMRLRDAETALDLVAASGLEQVRLLGGEPTLHPEFAQVVGAALGRGLRVLVFSNGLMPPAALAALLEAPEGRCQVMLNVNLEPGQPEEEAARVAVVAGALGERAFVGVNIPSPGLPLAKAAQFAVEHGLSRVLRVGLAQPRLDRQNRFLHPRHYRRVGEELETLLDEIEPQGFGLGLDCGFVPCMFRPEFLQRVGSALSDLGRRCSPIPDVLPDLTAVHCFPLGELDQLPLSGLGTVQEARELLRQRLAGWAPTGALRECEGCDLRRSGDCLGGCRAAALLRAHRGALGGRGARREGARPDPGEKWAIPYVDQPPEFWDEVKEETGERLGAVYFPIGVPGVGSGRPPQPGAHLGALLRSRIVPLSVLVNPIVLPGPPEVVGPRIVDELARLHEEWGVGEATLADARLAELVRARLPGLRLAASCLLEITEQGQAQALEGLFDVLVPSTWLTRQPERLLGLRRAFAGRLRVLVNEGCLDSCLERRQHFYEMALGEGAPGSLCEERLARDPWLRLTGAWILPQHVGELRPCVDEFKLSGRVTLSDPTKYRRVLGAYLHETALWPDEIGAGPASVTQRAALPERLLWHLLACDHACGSCRVCRRATDGSRALEAGA